MADTLYGKVRVCGAFILHACTCVYTCGLMPRVFFPFAHACDTRMPFKLWLICTAQLKLHSNKLCTPTMSTCAYCQHEMFIILV